MLQIGKQMKGQKMVTEGRIRVSGAPKCRSERIGSQLRGPPCSAVGIRETMCDHFGQVLVRNCSLAFFFFCINV